jgi:hypothetical protein
MPRPELLSDLCLAWQITAMDEGDHELCPIMVLDFSDDEIIGVHCQRPDDASCPALAAYLDHQVTDCGGCDNLLRYDPSPPGVCLPAGYYTECGKPDDPSECPHKQWEGDVPSEYQTGGE